MSVGIRWQLDFNHFGALGAALPGRADELAGELAERARERAEANTERIDTGAMRGELPGHGWMVAPLGDGLYIVYNTQMYAIFHELGTYKMTASPMLAPAIADTAADVPILAAGFWRLP